MALRAYLTVTLWQSPQPPVQQEDVHQLLKRGWTLDRLKPHVGVGSMACTAWGRGCISGVGGCRQGCPQGAVEGGSCPIQLLPGASRAPSMDAPFLCGCPQAPLGSLKPAGAGGLLFHVWLNRMVWRRRSNPWLWGVNSLRAWLGYK